jgi:hypothetical protein
MATCPRCKGHLTENHRCPRSAARKCSRSRCRARRAFAVLLPWLPSHGHVVDGVLLVGGGSPVSAHRWCRLTSENSGEAGRLPRCRYRCEPLRQAVSCSPADVPRLTSPAPAPARAAQQPRVSRSAHVLIANARTLAARRATAGGRPQGLAGRTSFRPSSKRPVMLFHPARRIAPRTERADTPVADACPMTAHIPIFSCRRAPGTRRVLAGARSARVADPDFTVGGNDRAGIHPVV